MPPPDPKTTPPPIADYELLRKVGRGSYGDVWLARTATGLFRAVKIVWRDRFPDVGPYEREFKGLSDFMRLTRGEVRQLALLHVGRDDDQGFFYYVMELADDVVTGLQIDPSCYEPLTLKTLREAHTFLPAKQVIQYGIELAAGLDELHRAGLLHRDIKPSNIILVDGRPKLADIGLVSTEQEANTFVGTIGFVPPEGPGSHAADVYSLGKVLYEIATGNDRIDFPRLPTDLGKRVDREDYLELNEVIIKAAASKTADRYSDAASLHDELQLLVAGKSVRRLRFAEAGVARARKWILLAVVVALVAGAGALLERRRADVESAARRAAEAELADLSRRTLHDASLAAAQRALETGNYGVAREALERAIPEPGDPDLRGFAWHALYREAQGDPAEIVRESGDTATRIEMSHDGRWVAVDNALQTVDIYDQTTGEFVRTLTGIHRVAGFSKDGNRLVGSDLNYALETWDLTTGNPDLVPAKEGINRPLFVDPTAPRLLYFEDGPENDPHRLAIWNYHSGRDEVAWNIPHDDKDGRWLFHQAAASQDLQQVVLVTTRNPFSNEEQFWRVLDMKTGELINPGFIKPQVVPIAISPEGKHSVYYSRQLFIGRTDGPSHLFRQISFPPLSGQIHFNRDGDRLIFNTHSNTIIEAHSEGNSIIQQWNGSGSQIDFLAYTARGDQIWSSHRGGEIRRWSRGSKSTRSLQGRMDLQSGYGVFDIEIDPSSKFLATVSSDRRASVRELNSLRRLWQKENLTEIVQAGEDIIYFLTPESRIIGLSTETGELITEISCFGDSEAISDAVATPSGNLWLVISKKGEIALWDPTKLAKISTFHKRDLNMEFDEILALAITDDGKVLTSDTKQRLKLWNAYTGEIEKTIQMGLRRARISISPNQNAVVLSGGAASPAVLEFPSLNLIREIKHGRENGTAFRFHPEESIVATQTQRGTIALIDFHNEGRSTPLEFSSFGNKPNDAFVSHLTFSPDGKTLVAIDDQGNIRAWHTD